MAANLSLFCALFLLAFTPSYAFRSQFITADGAKEDALLSSFKSLSPVEAALAASGLPEAAFPRYVAEFKRWESEIRTSLPRGASQYEIADRILSYIHSKVFTRYRVESTTLAEVFAGGLFNCLSATIVNGLLLQAFGIEVKGVALPTHVYLVAVLDGKPVEIENTIAQGLLISQDKNLQNQFNSLTGFNYGGGSKKMVISWSEVTGILYSNRSYFNAQRREYEAAFQNMMKAQALLASAPSEQSNLTAGYLNYSFYVFQRDTLPTADYLRMLEILQEGILRYPGQWPLKGNYTRGVSILLTRMLTNGTSDAEVDRFMASSKEFMVPKDYEKLETIRYPQQISYYLKDKKDFASAKRVLTAWYQRNPGGKDERAWVRSYCFDLIQEDLKGNSALVPNGEILRSLAEFPIEITGELYGHYFSELARKLFNNRKYEEAVSTMELGLNSAGRQTYITENGFAMAVNTAVVHFNQSRYEDALGYYKRALTFKSSPQLTRDIALVYGNLAAEAFNSQNYTLAKKWVAEGLAASPGDARLKQIQGQL